jgi:alkanesulfonate monooxygenase SsuD/methylene tetrahydromethanopterin reductase-like flavin-dependent oxidoreductase (luciferase family)
VEGSYAVVGSPETVTEQLAGHIARLGAGYLMGLFQMGTLPHELTCKNLQLFAQSVMPALRRTFPAGPAWAEAAPAA